MNESTLIHNVSRESLELLFVGISNQLTELKERFQPVKPAEYLTRSEVSKLLKCDLSTIHNWTKKGKLKAYGMGNRVYYKLSEIEDALTVIKL